MREVAYMAGPLTNGNVWDNIRAACVAADKAWDKGYHPFIPHLSTIWAVHTERSEEEWMEWCLSIVSKCDVLFRFGGESRGADREVELARNLKIPVIVMLQ